MSGTNPGRDEDRRDGTGSDASAVAAGPDETVKTVETESGAAEALDDVVSDPARADRLGTEWADEGGAVPEGPATSTRESAQQKQPHQDEGARLDEHTEEYGEAGLPQITLDPPD